MPTAVNVHHICFPGQHRKVSILFLSRCLSCTSHFLVMLDLSFGRFQVLVPIGLIFSFGFGKQSISCYLEVSWTETTIFLGADSVHSAWVLLLITIISSHWKPEAQRTTGVLPSQVKSSNVLKHGSVESVALEFLMRFLLFSLLVLGAFPSFCFFSSRSFHTSFLQLLFVFVSHAGPTCRGSPHRCRLKSCATLANLCPHLFTIQISKTVAARLWDSP